MSKQPLYPHVPKSRKLELPEVIAPRYQEDIDVFMKALSKSVRDEEMVGSNYRNMSHFATRLQLPEAVRILEQIAGEEYHHRNELAILYNKLATLAGRVSRLEEKL